MSRFSACEKIRALSRKTKVLLFLRALFIARSSEPRAGAQDQEHAHSEPGEKEQQLWQRAEVRQKQSRRRQPCAEQRADQRQHTGACHHARIADAVFFRQPPAVVDVALCSFGKLHAHEHIYQAKHDRQYQRIRQHIKMRSAEAEELQKRGQPCENKDDEQERWEKNS